MHCCLLLRIVAVALGLSATSGCLMCCNPEYEAYPAYGGAWERTDRYHGRVGSIIEPAGVLVDPGPGALDAQGNLVEEEAPPDKPSLDGDFDDPIEPLPEDLRPADPAPPLETRLPLESGLR